MSTASVPPGAPPWARPRTGLAWLGDKAFDYGLGALLWLTFPIVVWIFGTAMKVSVVEQAEADYDASFPKRTAT